MRALLLAMLCAGYALMGAHGESVSSAWQGEWGNFAGVPSGNGIKTLGYAMSISGCEAARCDLSLLVQGQAGQGDASGYLEIQSAARAIAHLISNKEEHCSLKLELVSHGPMIQAKRDTGDCTYFLTPGANFEHEYPFHSRDHYVGDIAACFEASAAALHALCTNQSLTDQAKEWLLLYLQVAELEAHPDELRRAQAARDEMLAACDHASDVEGCLREGFTRSTQELKARQGAWMASVTEPGDPMEAEKRARAIKGSYRHSFPNGDVSGNHFTSTDTLRIDELPDHSIRFSVFLEFYNVHECSLEGTARFVRAGFFAYQQKSTDASSMECVLEIVPDKDGVKLADPTGECKMMSCGARGGYHGAVFSFKDRR